MHHNYHYRGCAKRVRKLKLTSRSWLTGTYELSNTEPWVHQATHIPVPGLSSRYCHCSPDNPLLRPAMVSNTFGKWLQKCVHVHECFGNPCISYGERFQDAQIFQLEINHFACFTITHILITPLWACACISMLRVKHWIPQTCPTIILMVNCYAESQWPTKFYTLP